MKDVTGPIAKIRKVVKHGRSYYINLPKEFIELHHLKKGDRVPVLTDHVMKIIPMMEERYECSGDGEEK